MKILVLMFYQFGNETQEVFFHRAGYSCLFNYIVYFVQMGSA